MLHTQLGCHRSFGGLKHVCVATHEIFGLETLPCLWSNTAGRAYWRVSFRQSLHTVGGLEKHNCLIVAAKADQATGQRESRAPVIAYMFCNRQYSGNVYYSV